MDKETAVELERLRGKVDALETKEKKWNALIEKVVLKTMTWLGGIGLIGMFSGWHLPENVRKALSDWISR